MPQSQKEDPAEYQKDDSGQAPELDPQQQQQAREVARPDALVVHEVIRLEGEEELRRAPSALAWSALAAGLAMGFSMVSEGLLRAHLPHTPWSVLVSKLGYSVGFLIVVIGRQQLYTENTLTPVLSLLTRRDRHTLGRLLRLWGIVLLGNLLGALIFAWVTSHSDVFSPHVKQAFSQISQETMQGGAGAHLLRGIFAGWLIALMVWLLPGAEQSRVIIIFVLTYLVGVAGLSHVIAGSVDTLYGVCIGHISWTAYMSRFLLPTLLGNTLGGAALVAALNYGQVAPPSED